MPRKVAIQKSHGQGCGHFPEEHPGGLLVSSCARRVGPQVGTQPLQHLLEISQPFFASRHLWARLVGLAHVVVSLCLDRRASQLSRQCPRGIDEATAEEGDEQSAANPCHTFCPRLPCRRDERGPEPQSASDGFEAWNHFFPQIVREEPGSIATTTAAGCGSRALTAPLPTVIS